MTYYRTVVKIVVLSEDEPITEEASLEEIAYRIDEGHCVGDMAIASSLEVTPRQMASLLVEARSEPGFFQLD